MKWLRLYKPFLTSVMSFSAMYMTLRVSGKWKMSWIVFMSIVRYSEPPVYVLKVSTFLILMQQSTMFTSFEHSVLQMDYAHQSPNQNTVKEPWCWSSHWEALKQMLTMNACLDKLVAV